MRRGGAGVHGRQREVHLGWVRRKIAGEGRLEKLERQGL